MIILKYIKSICFGWQADAGDMHKEDRLFFYLLKYLAWLLIFVFLYMLASIFQMSWQAFSHFGLAFFIQPQWNSWAGEFGALALIYGTTLSSVLALILAVPVSVGLALFLSELAPLRVARVFSFFVEMLAAIPSIVYGLWGVWVLAPFLRGRVQPFFAEYFGFLPFFQGPYYGVGMMCGGVILAIMIIPTITSVSQEVFRNIPWSQREALLGIGATRWEMIRVVVLKGGRKGVIGAIMMGLGRAFGETMAVTMVIGNAPSISASLFAPAQTMSSILANQYAEAEGDLHLSSLTAVGFTLFCISLLIHFGLVFFIKRKENQEQDDLVFNQKALNVFSTSFPSREEKNE